MASIRKRGNSYTVTVSCGYDSKGKKILETATFTPDPKWPEERARKAAGKFAVRFNENIAKDESEMIPDNLTLHDLRHTTASILINKKLDPRSVSWAMPTPAPH